MSRLPILSLAGLFLLLARPVAAGTLHVPSAEWPTIQSALDAALPGDEVVVAKGTYKEALDVWEKKDIVLRAAGKVVLDAVDFNTGITIAFCENVEVTGITIALAREHSIVIGCSEGVLVSKCRIEGGDGDGVRIFSGTDIRLEKNVILEVALRGIRLQQGLPNEPGLPPVECFGPNAVQLVKNRIERVGADGIVVSGVQNVLDGNRIIDVGGVGILSLIEASGTTYRKNRVLGAGAQGIVLTGENESLEKNRVVDADTVGLKLESTAHGATLLGDRVLDSGMNGVEIAASGVTASGVKVVRAGAHAFLAGGNGNAFQACRAVKAWFDGFYVACTGSEFVECSAKSSGLYDLVDTDAESTTNTYVACKFKSTNLP